MNRKFKTASEYYRSRRPELFSDSSIKYEAVLTRELLSYELEQITTNQKQDLFESFCRRIVEKLITPNLIPQTGPQGGGDGKTDSETYPVSEDISERWFVPENGWEKEEKWAFAFSAKKKWRSKAELDIKSILATGRGYTRIFFISNQTISSKQKKETQDKFIKTYQIDIVIFDAIWLIEKVFTNDLIELATDSLNLSIAYKNKKIIFGKNDVERNKLLQDLETKIQNPKRYSEFDYQIVEDAIESAVLSRKLEKSRDEIEGKFDRAIRFCKKINLNRQWIKIHYQKAWTYLYYFDDYPLFIEEYRSLKKFITFNTTSHELELYYNLFNSLRGLCAANCNLSDYQIDLEKEKSDLYSLLRKVSKDKSRPCTSLIAEVDLSIQLLMDSFENDTNPDKLFRKVAKDFSDSIGLIEFPFESFNLMFEEMGNLFPANFEYDKLIELIASISEQRSSELSSARVYLKRASQKLVANLNKESTVFFGKAVLKLAKEESENELSFALRGLGYAFHNLGLFWASNNCFVSSKFILLKTWDRKGKIDRRAFDTIKELAINELILGRIPQFLIWHELLLIINNDLQIDESKEDFPTFLMLDSFLSVRLVNTINNHQSLSKLPNILERQGLWASLNAVFFNLGYIDKILADYSSQNINNETELSNFFQMVSNQPFRDQMVYSTDFLSEDEIIINSKILGCKFIYIMRRDIELLLAAETFAAFLENYLSTSIEKAFPKSESIILRLIRNETVELFNYTENDIGSEYVIEINKFSFPQDSRKALWEKMVSLSTRIILNNFFIDKEFIEYLFKYEELHERLAFFYEHSNFFKDIVGKNAKVFFQDWCKDVEIFPNKRTTAVHFDFKEIKRNDKIPVKEDFRRSRHDENTVISIIQDNLWNKAKWNGFGPFYGPDIGFGIFLSFKDCEIGKSIFDNWINRFGKEDNEGIIKITIIKGVNSKHPLWYKVHISANIDSKAFETKERYISVLARFHQMMPKNSDNLNRIEQGIRLYNKFYFCPACFKDGDNKIELFFEKSILVCNAVIKNAWELGRNDPASVVILEDDDPIIPPEIKNAPILQILKKYKK